MGRINNNKKHRGFTLIEVVIVLAILAVILTIVIFDFLSFKKETDVQNSSQEFAVVLQLAQSKTLSSENDSKYGVYLDTTVLPNKYILFKGASYDLRDVSADIIYFLPDTIEFYSISLGGGNEVVFNKLTGASEEQGSVSIRLISDINKNKTVYITSSGVISLNQPVAPSDNSRVKDSRHVQFNYSRIINVGNENIILTFDNSITQIIPISSYLVAGNLKWKGTVNVSGQNQTVEINTHWLNSTDTLFSVRRDMRYNNKILKITISGDSPNSWLAEYSADGQTVTSSSIYVSNFAWQ